MIPITKFLKELSDWAACRPDVRAVYLVGSYARRQARPDSDIDLVILTGQPGAYLQDTSWTGQFGRVLRQQQEDYGRLISLRVWYADGGEVEYGFSTPDWIAEPLDEGTAHVLAGGFQRLYTLTFDSRLG